MFTRVDDEGARTGGEAAAAGEAVFDVEFSGGMLVYGARLRNHLARYCMEQGGLYGFGRDSKAFVGDDISVPRFHN